MNAGEGKGYGITRVLEGGALWEKAACSVSVVKGISALGFAVRQVRVQQKAI